MEGPTVLERVAACLPCASWPCAGSGRHWQLWPSESFDDDARPILTAPTPALAECLIPPSVSNLYDDRDQTSPESSAPSWDIGAGRPPAHQMSGHRGHSGMALSPKGQAARGTDSLDRSSGQQGGIELKQAAANPLLGQFHLQDGGRFVKAKLLPVTPVLQSSRAESSNSGVGSAHSAGVTHAEGDVSGLEDFVANGNAAEETGNRGGFTHRHGDRERWQEEGEDLGGPPAA